MNHEQILQDATGLVAKLISRNPTSLKPDAALISSGLVDSFHLVDLAIQVEEMFGVVIDDTELDGLTFDTLDSLADLIAERRSTAA